jgi:hypothetical protein
MPIEFLRGQPQPGIVVGRDPPLQTFFFIVYDKKKKGRDDATLVWQGTSRHAMYELGALRAVLRPHATLTAKMAVTLYDDKDEDRA